MAQKQREKSKQTHKELMDAAYSLFEEKGFVATSIAEITERAGYAKGNFYRHWKSKDELFLDIMSERLQHYREQREYYLQQARSIEDITRIIISFLENMIEDHTWSKVFLEFTVHSFRHEETKSMLHHSRYRLSSTLFSQLFQPLVPDRECTRKLGALVTALFEGFLIQQALNSHILDKEDLREAIFTLAQSYLPELEESGTGDYTHSPTNHRKEL